MIWRVQGVEVGCRNQSKIDEKLRSRWEGLLASIFNGFGWILGAKLGPSWEGKSSQDGPRQAKTGQDKGSEGKGRERKRKGRDWKGKVWKSEAGEILREGGRGSRTARAPTRPGLPTAPQSDLMPHSPAGGQEWGCRFGEAEGVCMHVLE